MADDKNNAPEARPSFIDQNREIRGRAADFLPDRLKTWAAEVLADESPPPGIADEILSEVAGGPSPSGKTEPHLRFEDVYSLWSTMTALTQEIKLQGRGFQKLRDGLDPILEMAPALEAVIKAHDQTLDLTRSLVEANHVQKDQREKEIRTEAENRTRREMLELLLDLKERFKRGLNSPDDDPDNLTPTWIDRLLGRAGALNNLAAAARAREEGYILCLKRLEDALKSYGLREMDCLGRPFDPTYMKAVEIEVTDQVPEDQVMEVYRDGYEWNSEIFQTARVKVARRPQSAASHSD